MTTPARSEAPRKAIIIGYPVGHARSPLIHGYWLDGLGISGRYERAEVKPGEVAAFLKALPERGFAGGNITVPHKEEAYAACDRLTDRARAAGAVNTVWFEDGALVGDNTDGLGFVSHLNQTFPQRNHAVNVLILGAGGAARGLILPLLEDGAISVTVTNRSRERAQILVQTMRLARPDADIRVVDWDARETVLPQIDLLVNTTSLGMNGQPPLEIDLGALPQSAIVADIVYVPLETALLAKAKRRGLATLDGLGMLLHQAVPGFARWFGVTPEVTPALRAHLLADLEKKA